MATVFHREGREELEEGWLQKFWTLEEGDPMGRHVIHVFVEDELVRTFEFDVVPPPPQRDGTASQ